MMKFVSAAALLMLASCSGGFNREWRQALAEGKGTSPRDLTGPWQGAWRSEVNGHHGELRCIVSRARAAGEADSTNRHRFHYHATFMKVLSATYDVTHEVKQSKDGFVYAGDQKISGMGGGLYHYEGKGTPERFNATFRSESDHGVFELRRP